MSFDVKMQNFSQCDHCGEKIENGNEISCSACYETTSLHAEDMESENEELKEKIELLENNINELESELNLKKEN